jgi:hypothetical protein
VQHGRHVRGFTEESVKYVTMSLVACEKSLLGSATQTFDG